MTSVAPSADVREREAPASPAGPLETDEPPRLPPTMSVSRLQQTLRFGTRPLSSLAARQRYGDVWQVRLLSRDDPLVVTSHPDHVKSLFTAKPADAPSLTGESPLRPFLGPNSVLTSVGDLHMRQRKLLLPAFHGDAVDRYVGMISDVAEREIDRWRVGQELSLASRMQAVTLDVIMAGIFGIQGAPARGTPEFRLRQTIRRLVRISTHPLWRVVELQNIRSAEPRGILRLGLKPVDRQLYAAIRRRRETGATGDGGDVFSMLPEAPDE